MLRVQHFLLRLFYKYEKQVLYTFSMQKLCFYSILSRICVIPGVKCHMEPLPLGEFKGAGSLYLTEKIPLNDILQIVTGDQQ